MAAVTILRATSDAMNHRRHTILIAIVASVSLPDLAGLVRRRSREPPPSDPPKPPKVSNEGGIEYVGPDTYLLLDAEGRPQPVLGMSYEEFVAAWKKLQARRGRQRRAPLHDRRLANRRQCAVTIMPSSTSS